MSFIPKFINCPCCDTINIINVNGKSYENNFKILQDWTLKKLFNCRKCKSQLGLFIKNSKEYIQKLIWLDYLNCEEVYFKELNNLEKIKRNYKKNTKKHLGSINKIINIQNKIRQAQLKLKVKFKIENKEMVVRHVE